MTRTLTVAAALALLAMTGTARAAGPGEVLLTGGLPLPAGAIAGGNGGYADGEPTTLGVSADGRYVVFAADADALAPDAHPDVTHIFRKDRVTGEVVLVSRATGANGAAPLRFGTNPTISDDGARVAWRTKAALDPADTDDAHDVYVRDIATATTLLATPGTADEIESYDLSGNGAFVAFATADALAGMNDTNGLSDVYRRALSGGAIELVSRAAGSLQAGNSASEEPSISDDGRWVAFSSNAVNLVAGFVAGPSRNVFARDIATATAYVVSNQAGAVTTAGNAASQAPDIAGAPGAVLANVYVAYHSDATNVAPVGVDTSGTFSVYRRRLSETSSTLVSRATGIGGVNADSRAHDPSISDSGALVTFASDATNLGAGADYYGAYVRDVGANTTALASVDNAYAVQPAISDDGAVIAWINGAGGITPDSDPDLVGVFARASGGPPEYISRPPGTAPFLAPATGTDDSAPGTRTISADGRYVVFTGYSSHLPGVAGSSVYRRDTLTGALELVARATGAGGAPADRPSYDASISADGTRVVFTSAARLDPADTDDLASVYVRDLAAGTMTLASRADGAAGALPNAGASDGRIGAGGRHVTFVSAATNLGAAGGEHGYLRDLAAGSTQLVDRATGAAGAIGNANAAVSSLSGDGRLVVFETGANNLLPDDPAPSTARDVYVRDTVAQTTLLVSRHSGPGGAKAAGSSTDGVISADGRVVAFRADDETIAPEGGPWGGARQIVARDLASGQNALVSRAPGGAVADAGASHPSVSADGSVIAFASDASNLLAGVGGGSRDGVFARTMATGALSGPPAFGLIDNEPQNRAADPSLSDDGACMAFRARGHNAFTGAAGDFPTSYVYAISGSCPKPASPGGGAPQPPGAQPSRPAISRASLLRQRFRVGKRPTAKRASLARRAKAGTAFRFTLSTSADLTIALQRRAPGRRVGGTCRKPSRKLRKRPACVRYVTRGTLTRSGLAAKRHSIAFSGRIGRKALPPGRYRASLRARNAAGASKAVHLAFRVVRR